MLCSLSITSKDLNVVSMAFDGNIPAVSGCTLEELVAS